MCATCGCTPVDDRSTAVKSLERAVLAKNARTAEANRAWFAARDARAINIMASPGAGKTALLEATLARQPAWVIEGDQATSNDADRIRAAGGRAVQINTGTGCHLEAHMIEKVLPALEDARGLVFIENVGNLVCPALFDLGERARVVVASTTEGDDKPLKYPHMFHAADLVVLNKIDLLPHVRFSVDAFTANVRRVSHARDILQVSATRGDNLDAWFTYLQSL